jgi:hypothetical protein
MEEQSMKIEAKIYKPLMKITQLNKSSYSVQELEAMVLIYRLLIQSLYLTLIGILKWMNKQKIELIE